MLSGLGFFAWKRQASHRHAIDTIALMPFENVGGDASYEYLSDGPTDSLIGWRTRRISSG